jgi:hypothetical protein
LLLRDDRLSLRLQRCNLLLDSRLPLCGVRLRLRLDSLGAVLLLSLRVLRLELPLDIGVRSSEERVRLLESVEVSERRIPETEADMPKNRPRI